jgi:hypothetical protein
VITTRPDPVPSSAAAVCSGRLWPVSAAGSSPASVAGEISPEWQALKIMSMRWALICRSRPSSSASPIAVAAATRLFPSTWVSWTSLVARQ